MVISFYLLKGDVVREIERIYITIFEIIIALPSENCPPKNREKGSAKYINAASERTTVSNCG